MKFIRLAQECESAFLLGCMVPTLAILGLRLPQKMLAFSTFCMLIAWIVVATLRLISQLKFGHHSEDLSTVVCAGMVFWLILTGVIPNEPLRHFVQYYGWIAVISASTILLCTNPKKQGVVQ